MWRRRSWFSLKGKVGIRGSAGEPPNYSSPAPGATGRIRATTQPEVESNPALHVSDGGRSPARAIDLRPTRDARLSRKPARVGRDRSPVVLIVRQRMRARAYQRHLPPDH